MKKQYLWRKLNEHNETVIGTNCDYSKITVGNHTYGVLMVHDYNVDNERLDIGNYVSIANNVIFLLGGNHQINTFTTFPLKTKLTNSGFDLDASSKGPIIVEDEVWIGTSAIVLSGVKIGRGAIIAAGSVVTRDVQPYTIVGGNPAKEIKKRFSDDMIEKMSQLNLTCFSKEQILNNMDYFYLPVENSFDYLCNLSKNNDFVK